MLEPEPVHGQYFRLRLWLQAVLKKLYNFLNKIYDVIDAFLLILHNFFPQIFGISFKIKLAGKFDMKKKFVIK